jgi:hypothetical protein
MILRKIPTSALYVNVTLFTHVSGLKDPSSGSADIFCDQGQQNTWPDVNIGLKSGSRYVYEGVLISP